MQLFQKRDALARSGSFGSIASSAGAMETERNSVGSALTQLTSAVGCVRPPSPWAIGQMKRPGRGASGSARSAMVFHGEGGGSPPLRLWGGVLDGCSASVRPFFSVEGDEVRCRSRSPSHTLPNSEATRARRAQRPWRACVEGGGGCYRTPADARHCPSDTHPSPGRPPPHSAQSCSRSEEAP